MRARSSKHFDLGEAISMEDAISMMTIIFVLFVIFLVPLVSIDKAQLEAHKNDDFWGEVVAYLHNATSMNREQMLDETKQYWEPFSAYRKDDYFGSQNPLWAKVTEMTNEIRYVEILTYDSSLIVIKHDKNDNSFNSMEMTRNGETATFYYGSLGSISKGSDWFMLEHNWADDANEKSKQFNTTYRNWRQKSIGR